MDRLRNYIKNLTSSPSRLVATIAVLLIVVGAAGYGASQYLGPTLRGVLPLPATEFVQGEFLVKFQPGAPADAIRSLNAQNNATQLGEIPGIAVARMRVPTGSSVGAMVALYGRNPNVVYAEPNYIYTATDSPNDTKYANQWNLTKIGMPAAWDISKGSSSVTIAVIDSGINFGHEDLKNPAAAYLGDGLADDYGHGTQVVGIFGSNTNDTLGTAGLCPLCRVATYKVAGSTGAYDTAKAATALVSAADLGARVVNMSFGGYTASTTLQNAVNYAWGKGVVMVGGAGNDGVSTLFYPAAYAHVIAVGGSNQLDQRVSNSNYGTWVHLFAPGISVYTTTMAGSYTLATGTSIAAPHVAGVAGLMLSATPSLTNQQVFDMIIANTDDVSGLGKRLNAAKAVSAAAGVPVGTVLAPPFSGAATSSTTSTPTPAPTASPTPAPATTTAPATATPTAAPTATPTPAPTATPTPTAAPTATPTPAPTAATTTETFTGTVSKTGTSFREHTITVSAAGTITASVGGWTGNLNNNNLDLYLFSGATQMAAATTTNRPENLTFAVTTPGTYTLRVVAAAGTGTYTLTVTHP